MRPLRDFVSFLRYPIAFTKFKTYGSNIRLGNNGIIVRPEEISLGKNIFIAPFFIISARNLKIGDNVMIGPRLIIECEDHIFDTIGTPMWTVRKNKNVGFVSIGNDVWIGANVTILKNVRVHEGSIIGAGSVVTKDIPPYTVNVGNPCKTIRKRFTKDELNEHLIMINSTYTSEEIIELWEAFNI